MIIRAASDRRQDDYERQRALAHELAGLIAVGFHDPTKMPEYKPLAKKRAPATIATSAQDEEARGYLMLLALRSEQT